LQHWPFLRIIAADDLAADCGNDPVGRLVAEIGSAEILAAGVIAGALV
jgi:hypothetical protein